MTNSVLLLFQYHVYSSSLEENGSSFFYEQEIEMKMKDDKIIVKQHFSNMPKEKIAITWPIFSENRSCDLSTGGGCDRLSEDLATFQEGEITNQSISFEIPVSEELQDGSIMTDFIAKLDTGAVSYTTLHITDELKRGGMWVSGLPLVGNTSLDLIDYSLSFGSGNITELYWQKEVLPIRYDDNYFTLYSANELSEELLDQLKELHLPNSEHVSVLFGQTKNIGQTSRIVFIDNNDITSVQRDLVVKNVQLSYGFDSDHLLLADVISSYLFDRPIGSEKAVWMYETLNNYFTVEQLANWKSSLEKDKQLDAQKLDQLLSQIIALKTSFFTLNEQSGDDHFPLLFEDSRTVYINELQEEDMTVFFKDGKIFYAAEPLLSNLGYTLNDTEKGLYVQNATRAFRFPVKEPFYVLNEKRYDAMSEPFEKIGQVYYIEEGWMIRLFLLDIDKHEKRINITQSALF